VGLTSGPASIATSHSAYTSGLSKAPLVPDIWGISAIEVLRVTSIKPAVRGCEVLAPATSEIELRVGPGSGTRSPEPSVSEGEGPGTPS